MGPFFVGFIRRPIDEHFLARQGHALLAEDIGCRQMGRIARSQGQAAACRCQGTADLVFPFSFIIIFYESTYLKPHTNKNHHNSSYD